MRSTYIAAVLAAVLTIAIGVAYYGFRPQPSPVACTAEALICPDGSAVGRTGPDCSFAPCPSTSSNNLISDIYPLYPGATWGPEFATATQGLAGFRVSSKPVVNISDLSSVFVPFSQYYKQKLAALGWSEDISLAAGGPGSEITVYKKGTNVIEVSYKTVFHSGGVNSPVTCPCDISLSIFSGSPK